MNLPDAQNHPAFAYRPETGEEPYASLLAVPVRRAGHTLGVLTVQNRAPRLYTEEEVDVLETVAMLLAEVLAASGASDGAEEGVGVDPSAGLLRRRRWCPASRSARWCCTAPRFVAHRLLADDPEAELRRLQRGRSTGCSADCTS